jgi:cell cycle sensor histidine kinase DivJ
MIADRRALGQILLNLLSNAIRFTDRCGKVTVSARAEAATITFVVEDTGVGISDEDLARVGEPYFQARATYERRHGGTGLGLSIVKGLVRLQGGEMRIESQIGEGTRVTVQLPLDCERARATKTPVAKPPAKVTGHILVRSPSDAANNLPPAAMLDEVGSAVEIRVKKSA